MRSGRRFSSNYTGAPIIESREGGGDLVSMLLLGRVKCDDEFKE